MTTLIDPLTTHHLQRAAEALDIPPAAFVRKPMYCLHIACSSDINALQAAIDAVCVSAPDLVATMREHGEDAALLQGGAVVAVLLHRIRRTGVRDVKAKRLEYPRTIMQKKASESRVGYVDRRT